MKKSKNQQSPSFRRKKLAGLELNDLLINDLIPSEKFEKARITSGGNPIYDINGTILFYRIPLRKGGRNIGYTDISTNPEISGPVLAVAHGAPWKPNELVAQAKEKASKKLSRRSYDKVRFVAYSYPKIAIQFLKNSEEVFMLELNTWDVVPSIKDGSKDEPTYGFERWSYLDALDDKKKRSNRNQYNKRMKKWEELTDLNIPDKKYNLTKLDPKLFKKFLIYKKIQLKPITYVRELHYSPATDDHHICYELRSQLTNVWCVAGSVQMLLDFYRFNYDQVRLASELGLGTLTNPNGLYYGNESDVVTTLENLTSNVLDATLDFSPTYNQFVSEINANRPLISFIPGHSRTVAGYSYGKSILNWTGYTHKYLLVYDPWPPSTDGTPNTGGTITRWENSNTTTYRCTFTAQLKLV